MGRQKNPQSKGKEESADKELDEIRASNLSDTEFYGSYKELTANYTSMKKDINYQEESDGNEEYPGRN